MGMTNKIPKENDLSIGQMVTYRNSPLDWSIPMDGRVTEVVGIEDYRSRTTGNQCVKLKGDVFIRDINEVSPYLGENNG